MNPFEEFQDNNPFGCIAMEFMEYFSLNSTLSEAVYSVMC